MENLCIFYASKYHLSIVILEYLKNRNTEKYTVNTFLQNSIEDEIKILKQKYKIKINQTDETNFKNTNEILNKKIKSDSKMIFIVEGNLDYMKEANDYIKNSINDKDNSEVTIINCYDFNIQKQFMEQILKGNDRFLYTSGQKIID